MSRDATVELVRTQWNTVSQARKAVFEEVRDVGGGLGVNATDQNAKRVVIEGLTNSALLRRPE